MGAPQGRAISFPLIDWSSTNAKVKSAWSGARLVEIPAWLWFSMQKPIEGVKTYG